MKLQTALFTLYLLIWLLLAYNPLYREDWLLENILVAVALPIVISHERRFGFSVASAWMLFIFFILHAIGAYYTYSEMPWFSPITEFFGFERNHYDRLIHFLFGFLLFLPFYELFSSFLKLHRSALAFTLVFLMAASGGYEVIEWITAQLSHPELGTAFLGVQGDQWDSQKDMLACYLGSLASALLWHKVLVRSKRAD